MGLGHIVRDRIEGLDGGRSDGVAKDRLEDGIQKDARDQTDHKSARSPPGHTLAPGPLFSGQSFFSFHHDSLFVRPPAQYTFYG